MSIENLYNNTSILSILRYQVHQVNKSIVKKLMCYRHLQITSKPLLKLWWYILGLHYQEEKKCLFEHQHSHLPIIASRWSPCNGFIKTKVIKRGEQKTYKVIPWYRLLVHLKWLLVSIYTHMNITYAHTHAHTGVHTHNMQIRCFLTEY